MALCMIWLGGELDISADLNCRVGENAIENGFGRNGQCPYNYAYSNVSLTFTMVLQLCLLHSV